MYNEEYKKDGFKILNFLDKVDKDALNVELYGDGSILHLGIEDNNENRDLIKTVIDDLNKYIEEESLYYNTMDGEIGLNVLMDFHYKEFGEKLLYKEGVFNFEPPAEWRVD